MKSNRLVKFILEKPAAQAVVLISIITVIAATITEYFEASLNPQFSGIGDALWWVLVTISTVGYGDKVPVTPVGRTMAVIIMFFGVALLSIVTATISSIFVTRKIKEGKGLQEIKLSNHILLCGWNKQAESIIATIESEKTSKRDLVMINQITEEQAADIMSRFKNIQIRFVRGDFTREPVLIRANAKSAASAIILPDTSTGNLVPGDERTILGTLSLKTLNPKIKVYAHLNDPENLPHLRKAKADEVVISDQHSGYLLAKHAVAPGVPQFFEQLFSEQSGFKLVRKIIPPEWIKQTFELFRTEYQQKVGGILLGLGKISEPFNLDDLMGDDYSYLDEFIIRKFQEAGRGSNKEERVKISINPAPDTIIEPNDFFIALESE